MMPLPFGLVLKWANGASLDEVEAMMAIRKAGIPAPRVISYGEHSWTPWAPVSILMTRLPGVELDEIFPKQVEQLAMGCITDDLRIILNAIRS